MQVLNKHKHQAHMSLYPSPGVKCEKVNDRKQTQTDTTSPLGFLQATTKWLKEIVQCLKCCKLK